MFYADKKLICKNCKTMFTSSQTRSNYSPKFCSARCFGLSIKGIPFTKNHCQNISLSKRNEKHPRWKGNKAKYDTFHHWIRLHFGSASQCSNKLCSIKKPIRYDWALIHGRKHSHDRTAYIELCRSCHRKYDYFSLKLKK